MKFTLRNASNGFRGRPVTLRVPGVTKPIGLGTAIGKATSALGVKPCDPCKRRAESLNKLAEIRGLRDRASGPKEP